MNIGIILIGLLCFTVQHGKGKEVHCEGRDVVLRFIFPRRDIDVTLQFGNRFPFYSNGQLVEAGLSKDQVYRFEVKEYVNDSQYVMLLTISHLSRKDGGTYVGIAYENGEMIGDLTRTIALIVKYPPGDPHCRHIPPSSIDVIHDTWDIIECTAPLGTMPGYIMCFQNNEPLPMDGNMRRNTTSLSQRLWVKRGYSFSCCSTDFRHRVNASSCKAFQYEMTQSKLTTTPTTYDTPIQSPNSSLTNKYEYTYYVNNTDILVWIKAGVFIMTFILLFIILLVCIKVSKVVKGKRGHSMKLEEEYDGEEQEENKINYMALKKNISLEDDAFDIDSPKGKIETTYIDDNQQQQHKSMRQEFRDKEQSTRQVWNKTNENIEKGNEHDLQENTP